MTSVKRLLLSIVIVPLLLIAGAVIFVLTLDPNRLKPFIVDAAEAQGITLAFKGNLSWQFYPQIGVSLGEALLTNPANQPLLKVGNAAVSVKLMPLLKRKVEVNGIELSDAHGYFLVDKTGATNWSFLNNSHTNTYTEPDANATKETKDEMPTIEVDSIEVRNLRLDYSDAQTNSKAQLSNLHFSSQGFSLEGVPFPIQLSLTATYNESTPLDLTFTGPIGVDFDQKNLSLDTAQLTIASPAETVRITLNNNTYWGDNLTSTGHFNVATLSPKKLLHSLGVELPIMHSKDALTQFSLGASYQYSADAFKADTISATLDNTVFNGNLQVTNFTKPDIKSHWTGTTLNLDDYLATPIATKTEQATKAPATPLPLAPLRPLTLDIKLAMQTINTKGLAINAPVVALTAHKGLITLKQLNAKIAQGNIAGKGTLDGRTDEAKLALNVTSTNIELGELLSLTADIKEITGELNTDAVITSHGRTDKDLMDNLNIKATAQSKTLQITPINLEKAYCQAVALLQQKTLPEFDWPQLTKMEPLTLQIEMTGPQLNIEALTAQIAKLTGAAHGSYNLDSGKFNIPFTLSPGNLGADIEGCLAIPEKWRKRRLPIRCKGNLNDLGLKTCLPDTKLIGNLIKDKAQQKLGKEKDKLEGKLKVEARELLDKNVKEEHKDFVEDKLKDLLKGLKK